MLEPMRDVLASFRHRTAMLGLETAVARAGRALACPFASSAEFEAALIRRKIAAYDRRRRQYYAFAAAAVSLFVCVWLYAL